MISYNKCLYDATVHGAAKSHFLYEKFISTCNYQTLTDD